MGDEETENVTELTSMSEDGEKNDWADLPQPLNNDNANEYLGHSRIYHRNKSLSDSIGLCDDERDTNQYEKGTVFETPDDASSMIDDTHMADMDSMDRAPSPTGFSGSTVVDDEASSNASSKSSVLQFITREMKYQQASNKNGRTGSVSGESVDSISLKINQSERNSGRSENLIAEGADSNDTTLSEASLIVHAPVRSATTFWNGSALNSPEEDGNDDDDDDEDDDPDETNLSPIKDTCHSNHKRSMKIRKMMCAECEVIICPICYRDVNHLLVHHMRHGIPQNCPICMISLPSECALKVKYCPRPETCPGCNEWDRDTTSGIQAVCDRELDKFRAQTTYFLQAHINMHSGESPYVCPSCGYFYVQKKFFAEHSVKKCTHFFMTAQFLCDLCIGEPGRGIFYGLEAFREHQTSNHLSPAFWCSQCQALLVTSQVNALLHAKTTHGAETNSWSLAQCGLKKTQYCAYCDEQADKDHLKVLHTPKPVNRHVYKCQCGIICESQLYFRRHRTDCKARHRMPVEWKALFKESDSDEKNRDLVNCSDCPSAFLRERDEPDVTKCESCKLGEKRACLYCSTKFVAEQDEEYCEECNEFQRDAAVTNYNGEEQVVGEKRDALVTCDIDYDEHLDEHNYVRRFDVITNLLPELKLQREEFHVPFFKTADLDDAPDFERDPYPSGNDSRREGVICCVCKVTIMDIGIGKLDSTIEHFRLFHWNAAIPFKLPADLKQDDQSPIPNGELNDNESPTVENPRETRDDIVPSKNEKDISPRSKEVPSKVDCLPLIDRLLKASAEAIKKGKVLLNKKQSSPKVSRKSGEVREKCTQEDKAPVLLNKMQTSPKKSAEMLEQRVQEDKPPVSPEKEHEFWDKAKEALTTAEHKKPVSEILSKVSNKRSVKRPKRYASEDESDDKQELAKVTAKEKASEPSTLPKVVPPTPEETITSIGKKAANQPDRLLSSEKSCSSEGEPGTIADATDIQKPSPKRKRNRNERYYDPDIERLKAQLKTDKEMSFIAKTFDSSSTSPNRSKRKRRPSSKLRYNQLITASAPATQPLETPVIDVVASASSEESKERSLPYQKQICCVCNVKYETQEEFLAHIRTHRTHANTFQCMECGECFVIRTTFAKHLHFFHKIADPDAYIHECEEEGREELLPFQCRVCQGVYQSKSDLSKHFRIHGSAFLKEVKYAKI